MTQAFLVCAVIGGALLAFQLLLTLFGLAGDTHVGGGHDFQVDHAAAGHGEHNAVRAGTGWLVGFVTFRNLVAGLTFFGLVGLATSEAKWQPAMSAAAAAVAGVLAIAVVGLIMKSVYRLQDDGTVDIRAAVGQTGTVYVSIPGNKSGTGKVQIDVQNRTAEYQAVTFADPLTTGSKVVVVDVVGPDTLEVIPAPQYGRMQPHA